MTDSLHPIFRASETHGRALRPGNRLVASSEEKGWRSLHAAILEEAPIDLVERAIQHPSLIYHLRQPAEVSRKIESLPAEKTVVTPRRITITPANVQTRWRHEGHPEILQIYLRNSVYESAARETHGGDSGTADIVPCFAVVDPLLEQLLIAITKALREASIRDSLYIETLAQLIALHLARTYSTRSRAVRASSADGLTGARVSKLMEFVEENLAGDLSLEAMASEVNVSPVYLVRAFKGAVGEPPHRYVLIRRIERAKELLRDTEFSIVEVALATGFSSQSHLSSWFRRFVGVSPAIYRGQRFR